MQKVRQLFYACISHLKNSLFWRKFVKVETRLKTKYQRVPRLRYMVLSGVVLLSACFPTVNAILKNQAYHLSEEVRTLIGEPSRALANKLTFNAAKDSWQFNSDGLPIETSSSQDTDMPSLAQLKAQLGGSGEKDESLYAVDMPSDGRKGVAYYDTNTGLSFTLKPQFHVAQSIKTDAHIVYAAERGMQLVYTAKANGMKEDIILNKPIGDEVELRYTLELPDELEGKILDNGAIGIYGINPALYSAQASTDIDAEKLRSARESAPKDYLIFGLPAPVIVDNTGRHVPGSFSLTGDTLTIHARGLEQLSYPLSIDPSVVVTSSNDFTSGNNEGNISFEAEQISRAGITGGTVGTWATTTVMNRATENHAVIAYNGYMYRFGGYQRGVGSYFESYSAPINNDGTLGSWTRTVDLPHSYSRPAITAYNGYVYMVSEIAWIGSPTVVATTYYSKINNDGTLGSWTQTTDLPQAITNHALVATGGYIYTLGGSPTNGGGCGANNDCMDTVYYAPLNADGTIGSWATTTSFATARAVATATVYNGYMYISGGAKTGYLNDVQYARINSDGTLGGWMSTSSFTNARYGHQLVASGGYMYLYSGRGNGGTGGWHNDVQYAQINANGTLGKWTTTSSFTTPRAYGAGAAYNGYLYLIGGYNGSVNFDDVQYTKIDPAGFISTNTTTTALGASLSNTTGACSVAYNNYIYHIGGYTGSTYTAQVIYAPINNDGTLGTWATTNSLASPISGGTGLGTQSCAAIGGRVYTIGGRTRTAGGSVNVASIQYASFNSNGTLSSWTLNPTDYPGDVNNQAAAGYNGYVYSLGFAGGGLSDRVYRASVNSDGTLSGWTRMSDLTRTRNYDSLTLYGGYLYVSGGGVSGGTTDTVEYVKINDDGTLGTWTTTSSMTEVKRRHTMLAINGYLYAVGGEDNSSSPLSTVEYAKINSDGTLGTWTRSADLTVTFNNSSAVAWNDTIYAVSGEHNAARSKNVLKLTANNGGTGATGSWTAATNSLSTAYPGGIAYNSMFTYDGYVYTVGGISNSTYVDTVWSAPLQPDGSTGTWTQQASLPGGRSNFALGTWGGHVYVCAGTKPGGVNANDCTYAKLQSGGGLGTWSTTQTMNLAAGSVPVRGSPSGTAYGGYMYVLGGADSSVYNTVYYAPLNASNGSVGTWQAGPNFPTARTVAATFAANGYLYLLGGSTSTNGSSGYLDDAQVAPLNSGNGSVGAWQPTTSLARPRAFPVTNAANGYLYVYGGTNTSGGLNYPEQAPILASGQLGPWQRSGSATFANTRFGAAGAIANGYIYLSSGRNSGGTYFSDVQYAPLSVQARTGRYSKLIDLGGVSKLNNITYGGTLPGGAAAIRYRTAGDNGVLGTRQQADAGPQPASACTGAYGNARYVWLDITLDDSTTAVFPDSSLASLTDITVDYSPTRPSPDQRLRGGKTLVNGNLSPLDTCGS